MSGWIQATMQQNTIFRLQGIKVLWRLQFLKYLRTLSLKFQKAWIKIEVVLTLHCWLSQPILVRAFWNFKLKVLKYPRNCSLHNTLIPNLVKLLNYILDINTNINDLIAILFYDPNKVFLFLFFDAYNNLGIHILRSRIF